MASLAVPTAASTRRCVAAATNDAVVHFARSPGLFYLWGHTCEPFTACMCLFWRMQGSGGFLVNWAADNRFKDPKLPDDMHLSVGGKTPELQVQLLVAPTSKR
jgi:hypothetical protein